MKPLAEKILPAPRTALVLSAGAMFGAYHAGVWKALAPHFAPDVVIGASVGSLNGWAIAGGIDPELLISRWIEAEEAGRLRFRVPRHWLDGVVRIPHLEEWIREMHAHFNPRTEYALVLTRLWPFRPELVRGPEVSWQHIASSCAMPLLFPHYRLNGAVYTDGGLMQAMPLWPLAELGCRRAVAINCLATLPFPGGRLSSKAMRAFSRHRFAVEDDIEILDITPSEALGNASDFLRWKRSNVERWVELGYRDGLAAVETNPGFFAIRPAPFRQGIEK